MTHEGLKRIEVKTIGTYFVDESGFVDYVAKQLSPVY